MRAGLALLLFSLAACTGSANPKKTDKQEMGNTAAWAPVMEVCRETPAAAAAPADDDCATSR
jgi:Flp pilus assembly protein TadD